MSQNRQTVLAKLELAHFIETAFVHSWHCKLLFQVQEIVLRKMSFHNETHNVSTTLCRQQQQYYNENNSSDLFLCVYIWAVFCKSSHTVTWGHVLMSRFRGLCQSLNFYKEYLFGFETLVFATSGILSMHKQLITHQRERKMWNCIIWPL